MRVSHTQKKTVPADFVPLAKQSPKKRRAYYAAQRGRWGGLNPVTRVCPNAKGYDRAKMRRESRDWT